MDKRRLRIVKFAAIGAAVMALAWGASAIAVYAASAGRVFDAAHLDAVPRRRAAVVMGCVSVQKVDNAPVVVLDLNRYLGEWHEIARFDHSFERGVEQVNDTACCRRDPPCATWRHRLCARRFLMRRRDKCCRYQCRLPMEGAVVSS